MNFLDQNYKMPSQKGNYLKLEKGTIKVRILDKAITGWIDWDKSGDKPKPVRTVEKQNALHVDGDGKPVHPKHFWAMPIYDYQDETIKIWEITQKQIMNDIMDYYNTEELGDPKKYDLKITKEWDGLGTKYGVVALPPAPLNKDIEKLYKETPINMNALFDGLDPFEDLSDEQEML